MTAPLDLDQVIAQLITSLLKDPDSTIAKLRTHLAGTFDSFVHAHRLRIVLEDGLLDGLCYAAIKSRFIKRLSEGQAEKEALASYCMTELTDHNCRPLGLQTAIDQHGRDES